jgi:hypothetical protein
MKFLDVDTMVISGTAGMIFAFYYIILYNRMMAYVEEHAFSDPNRAKK